MLKTTQYRILSVLFLLFSVINLYAQDTYEVTFTVDLSVQEEVGLFDASSQTPRITGNFTGWATTDAPSLTSNSDGSWTTTLDVPTDTSMSKLEYKFILTNPDGYVFWEYAFGTASLNREYAFTGSETDSDSNGKKEIAVNHYFNDFGPEVLDNSIATAWMFPGGTPNLTMSGIITRAKGRFVFVQQDDWALQLYRNEDSNFWESIDNGTLGVGDEIEFTGTMRFFEGLSNIHDVSNVTLLSSDNELPAPVELTVEELTTSFKDYQSELVLIKDLKVHAPDGGSLDHLVPENFGIRLEEVATGNLIDMYIGYAGDSEVAWNFLPRQFDYEGVVGYYNPKEMTPHQLRPLYTEDLMVDIAPFGMPLPPHNNGDNLIVGGSFENIEPEEDLQGNEQWYFNDDMGVVQYNVVERTDVTSHALEVVISEHNDFATDWFIVIGNPWFAPADNESIKISFNAKGSVDGMRVDGAINLGEAFGYQRAAGIQATLSTEWGSYEFTHFVEEGRNSEDMYFEILMNYAENSGGTIMIDDVKIEQIETTYTPVTFSVNMASMIKIGDFDPEVDQVMLMGEKVNGWNTGAGVPMTAINDSIYSVDFEFTNLSQDEVIMYKFMRFYIEDGWDQGYGTFESPDPLSDATDGPFQNRLLMISDLTGVTAPISYFNDIEPIDLDINSHSVTSIEDLDLDVDPSLRNHHVAVQGIVTKISHNTVYIEDDTDAMMIYSYVPGFEPFGYAFGFNELSKDGTIEVGDEIKVAGINTSWNGGSMLAWAHAFEIVSSGNATPAQQIGLADLVNDGEFYENKLVQINGLAMNEEADTLRGGIYEIIEPATGATNYMWIRSGRGGSNSAWDGMTPPAGVFSFKGVVQQVNLSTGTFYVPVPIDFSDITQEFAGTLTADMAGVLVGDTTVVDVYIENLNTTLFGFEAEITYNPEELSVEPVVEDGYGFDSFLVQSNEVSPGRWVVSAASAEGLDQDGPLFGLLVSGNTGGEFDITMSKININEEAHPDVMVPFLVASRLCGDVTNDQTISALDATFILRNSVYLAPQFPLVDDDSLAADVTANGDITAFDASQILQYEVGLLDEFACGFAFKKAEPVFAKVDWSLVDTFEGNSTIEVEFSAPTKGIYSTEMTIDLPDGVTFIGLDEVPEGLQQMIHRRENQVHISLFGVEGLDSGEFLVQLETHNNSFRGAKLSANFQVNENPSSKLDEIGLVSTPTSLHLSQNYPNPFNPTTQIAYQLPDAANVRLSIFNLLGQEVEVLVNERKEAGSYTASWNAGNLSSGVYMYRLEVGSNVITKRMTLIK